MSRKKKMIIGFCSLIVILILGAGVFYLSDNSNNTNDKKTELESSETSDELEDKMLNPDNETPLDIIEDDESVESNINKNSDSNVNKDVNNSSETVIPDTGNELPVDHFTDN